MVVTAVTQRLASGVAWRTATARACIPSTLLVSLNWSCGARALRLCLGTRERADPRGATLAPARTRAHALQRRPCLRQPFFGRHLAALTRRCWAPPRCTPPTPRRTIGASPSAQLGSPRIGHTCRAWRAAICVSCWALASRPAAPPRVSAILTVSLALSDATARNTAPAAAGSSRGPGWVSWVLGWRRPVSALSCGE